MIRITKAIVGQYDDEILLPVPISMGDIEQQIDERWGIPRTCQQLIPRSQLQALLPDGWQRSEEAIIIAPGELIVLQSVQPLLEVLKFSEKDDRNMDKMHALQDLAKLGKKIGQDNRILQAIIKHLRHRELWLDAFHALMAVAPPSNKLTISTLIRSLHAMHPEERGLAWEVLSKICNHEDAPLIARTLNKHTAPYFKLGSGKHLGFAVVNAVKEAAPEEVKGLLEEAPQEEDD